VVNLPLYANSFPLLGARSATSLKYDLVHFTFHHGQVLPMGADSAL
jgi:hypothetical protein